MRAVFVTNQLKTEFYNAIARRMRALGAEVFWISVSERWKSYLLDAGWPAQSILSLPDFGSEWQEPLRLTDWDRERLARIESHAEAGLKNILIMDRELNKQPGLQTEAYVAVVTRVIERFVLDNDITHGFGEPTWAPEMLTSEVLRANGRGYFMHHTIRVPSGRVGFFEGIFHDKLVELRAPGDADRRAASVAVEAIRSRQEKPYYFLNNQNPQRFRPHWIDEAVYAFRRPDAARYDHTVPSLLTRGRRRIAARYRAAQTRNGQFFTPPPDGGPSRPYVLIPLHKQPEASVDVFGNAMSNQLETIRAMARTLPFDWEIWVKEHSHAIGDRSTAYYRALASIPGVRLIDPGADTFGLIKQAGLVASVAGTASMEAGIMGVPAITFGRLFFAPLLVADGVDPYAMTRADMAALLARAEVLRTAPDRDGRVQDFVAWCIAQSFEGLVSDPVSNPDCLDVRNIEVVAHNTMAMMRATGPGRIFKAA